VRLTIHTYGHLDVEDVREGIARSFTGTTVQAGLRLDCKPADRRPWSRPGGERNCARRGASPRSLERSPCPGR
jgi:hypothetical protein